MADLQSKSVSDLLALTARIVSAHIVGNPMPAETLPELIARVHGALANAGTEPTPEPKPQPQRRQPAVPVRKSIQPDYLVCLEDGTKHKMLKRYLRQRFGLEPDEYRARWGLPPDYPMVAPNYAAQRSTLAKALGLGRRRRPPQAASAKAEATLEGPPLAADLHDEAEPGPRKPRRKPLSQ